MAANFPLRHVALSADGDDVAVAGNRGVALYNRRSSRWRLFGDVSQEREIAVQVSGSSLPAMLTWQRAVFKYMDHFHVSFPWP